MLPNGYLASSSGDYTIKIWNTDNATLIRTLTGHSDAVTSLVFLPNGYLASGSWDNTIKIWNVSIGSLFQTLEGHTKEVFALTKG